MTIGLVLPKLRNDQCNILLHPAKRKVAAMGRRYGKTVTGFVAEANVLRQHGKCAWTAPTYKNSRPLWRMMERAFTPLVRSGAVSINKSDRVITTSRGGFFAVYSGENIDAMLGEWFHLVINDEAARLSEQARYDVIEPTVADYDGEIIDISTPKGKNWFWREYIKGQGGGVEAASFHAPTNANPLPGIQKAFILARERVPDISYRQEWLAEFVDDAGGVFRRVMEAATATALEHGVPGRPYAFGVDWGQAHDFTVIAVLDMQTRTLVHLDRFNRVDYVTQRGRLAALAERFRPVTVIAELNAMGQPIVEQLARDGLPMQGFVTTNATKTAAIDALALAFERAEISILPDPVLIGELQAYEMQTTRTGLRSFSAPEGMHDDTVMALALAWQTVANRHVTWQDLAGLGQIENFTNVWG